MNIVLDVLRYLNEHDITLVKAAEATGVAQQNIKKSIGNNPKTSTLLALAKGLSVDPREFFYDLDEKEKVKNDTQENIEKPILLESSVVTEDETEKKMALKAIRNQIVRKKKTMPRNYSRRILKEKEKQ